MPIVEPFCALRFDPDRVDLRRVCASSLSSTRAPGRSRLLRSEPRHVAHLDGDGVTARFLLADWTRAGVVLRDEEPAFYAVRQRLVAGDDDEATECVGFFARVRASEDVRQLSAASGQPASALFSDPKRRVRRTLLAELEELDPDARVELDGNEFELFVIDDETVCARLAAHLEAAAFTVIEGGPGEEDEDFIAFVAPADDGARGVAALDLLVTTERTIDDVLDSARVFFDVEPVDESLIDVRLAGGEVIVIADSAFALRLRDDAPLDAVGALDEHDLPPPASAARLMPVVHQLLADASVEAAPRQDTRSGDRWCVRLPCAPLDALDVGGLPAGFATIDPPVAAGLIVGAA